MCILTRSPPLRPQVAVDVWAKKAEKDELAAERSEKAATARRERKERATNGKSEGERRSRHTRGTDKSATGGGSINERSINERSINERSINERSTGSKSTNGRPILEEGNEGLKAIETKDIQATWLESSLTSGFTSGTDTPVESGTELDDESDTESVVVALSEEEPATEVRVRSAEEPRAPPSPRARPPIAAESEQRGGFWGRAKASGRSSMPAGRGVA